MIRHRLRSTFGTLRWRVRLTLWLGALAASLVVVLFAELADLALSLFFALEARHPYAPLLLTPAIGALVVWATLRFAPGSQGSGIPQVIAAIQRAAQGHEVSRLASLRIAAAKVLLGALALVGGFSAGREGPSVQVSASILHAVHRFLPHARAIRSSDLLLAGGAAGVAAAFNTPLAGIVFAVEELGRRLEVRTSGILLSTIILAGLTSNALLGNYAYFGHLSVGYIGSEIMWPVLACGVVCGLAGGSFSRLLLWPQQRPQSPLWRWRAAHPVRFAALCGLVVAMLGIACGGLSFGSGYTATTRVVTGELELPWHAPIARYLATVVSYYSGIPGGIFAPALAVGAALGSVGSTLLHLGEHVPLIALCMAGFLAAATQSPITAAIIVMEMIDSHGMVISLMAVALLAKAVSSRISPELYKRLAEGFIRDPLR